VRRQVVRRNLAVIAAAATVALLVAGGGVALSARLSGAGPAAGGHAHGSLPRYYVDEEYTGGHDQLVTEVRATATGAVTDTVRCPRASGTPMIWPIAAGGHQTYFIGCGSVDRHGRMTHARIYRFRVTAAGHVSGYALVPGSVLRPGDRPSVMAATADGSELAIAVNDRAIASAAGDVRVIVINTRTGARAVWRNDVSKPGAPVFPGPSRLSFADRGRELVVFGWAACLHPLPGGGCHHTGIVARALTPASAGGWLDRGRVLLHRPSRPQKPDVVELADAIINPAGTTLTIVLARASDNGPSQLTVLRVTLATGRRQVLYQAPRPIGYPYRWSSIDPSGRYVLLDAGPGTTSVNGWINNGRLTRPKPAGDRVIYAAW
jgi:hypothetical protein